ncbi:MAG TPA: S8 family serine peptidase [Thermoleophilaceae bacterium]|nr:S8 family serine peptidase [Thermoleophilaceae bacterium]
MTDHSGRDRRRWALLGAIAIAAAIPGAAPGPAMAKKFVAGEAIVRYKSGTTASERSASRARAGVSFKRSLRIGRAQLVAVGGSVGDAVARLNRQPDVRYAQPNFVYRATAAPPNDTRFGELWGLRNTGQVIEGFPGTPGVDVNVLGAWDTTRGAGAVIAIVDTGVDQGHPDLAANIDPVNRADFVDGDGNPDDEDNPDYHGTHVAGSAGAVDNNFTGIAGVAPDARIMAVRVLDASGGGSSESVANGIDYAATHGADVINLSLGQQTSTDPVVSSAVDVANGQNTVVVAAAGNEGMDNDSHPSIPCVLPQPNLVCAASVDNQGALTSFSNYGPTTVDLGAPGRSILSAFGHQTPADAYHYLDGTSMAAPHVSGAAALVRRGDTSAADTEIVQAIKESARPLEQLRGVTVTGGLVDAAAAIRRALVLPIRPRAVSPPPPPPTPPGKAGFEDSKRSIRVSRTWRFSFTFTAASGLTGRITLKTVRRVRPRNRGRKRRATFANKTFTVPVSGKVKVRFKLSRRNRRILKRYGKLRTSVTVKLRNSADLTSTAKLRITLKAPKRRR